MLRRRRGQRTLQGDDGASPPNGTDPLKTHALSMRLMRRLTSVALLGFLLFGIALARAQTTADALGSKPVNLEELSQAELLKAYLQVRDQLHATQLTVLNNRLEAESAARTQAAALTERLDAIKAAMEAERERQRQQAERAEMARQLQQQESERSYRMVLWVATGFGAIGLVALLATPFFQWRAIKRLADTSTHRNLPLEGSTRLGLLPGDSAVPSDQAVVLSNQRLMTVIDRLERRVLELEGTATEPLPVAAAVASPAEPAVNGTIPVATVEPVLAAGKARIEPQPIRRFTPAGEQEAMIATMLGRARTLLAKDQLKEALASYDEILQIDVNHPEALLKKGMALERLKRDNEALRCYDRAIAADRRMTRAYLYKGGVCNRLGRYNEALECYEMALQTEEEEPLAARRSDA